GRGVGVPAQTPADLELHGLRPGLLDAPPDPLDLLLRRRLANEAGDIDRHPVTLAPAEQIADGFAGGFAEKVEKSGLGPCDRRPERRPRVLVVPLVDVDLVDQRFEVAGIAPREKRQDSLFQHRSEETASLADHDEALRAVPRSRAEEMD